MVAGASVARDTSPVNPPAALSSTAYRACESTWSVPLVVSVQSRVAMGHVGNSAATPVLQLGGCEVADVPTALLSNHPFYPGFTGGALPAGTVADLLAGLAARGVPRTAAAVISGYLGTPDTASVLASWLVAARREHPELRYVCDPVLGDLGPGLYVDPLLPARFADDLLPLADAVTPNPFELRLLAEALGAARDADPLHAARVLLDAGPRVVIVTGARLPDTPPDALDTVVVAADAPPARVRGPFADRHFDGTGDVFTALFTAAWVRGADPVAAVASAVGGTGALVAATAAAGTKELQLVACRAALTDPPPAPVLPV